jgi:hypothetical protein
MKIRRIAAPHLINALIIASALFVIIMVGAIYMLPTVVKSKLPEIIQRETGRKTSISKVEFAPFSQLLSLHGFEMQEQNGQPFASFETFSIKINALQSLKQFTLVLDDVLLTKPSVSLARQKNGIFNFQDLVKNKREARQQDTQIFPLLIGNMSISEGKLAWQDAYREKSVKEEIYPLNLIVKNFTAQSDKLFNLDLSFTLNSGGYVNWQGTAGINPLYSEGHIRLDKLQLARILALTSPNTGQFDLQGSGLFEADYKAGYVDKKLTLAVNKSRLDLRDMLYEKKDPNSILVKLGSLTHETDFKASYVDNNWLFAMDKAKTGSRNIQLTGLNRNKGVVKIPDFALEAGYQGNYAANNFNFIIHDGKLDSHDVRLTEQGQDKALVKIPAIALRGMAFNLKNRTLSIDSASANDADLQVGLNADGSMNYQALLAVPDASENGATAVQPKAEPKSSPWSIKVNNIAFTNGGVEFEDRTLTKPLAISLKPINFKLTHYDNKAGVILPFQLSAGVNKSGLITLDGDTVIQPLSARIAVDVKDIELEKFQAYVEKFIRIDVIDGSLNINGEAFIAKSTQDKLDIKFDGDTQINDLLTRDQLVRKDLVKWRQLTLKDMAADLLANSYSAKALVINEPYARVVIRKDKTVNYSDIVIAHKTKPVALVKMAGAKVSDSPKPSFKLGKVQITNGSSDFADLSLILPFSAQIKGLDGGARGISSEQKSTVTVALNGNAYGLSPVDVKGEISPYLGDYKVEINFNDLPMPLVSAYMAQFSGYKVEKGKMWLTLKYNVVGGRLTASNNLVLDQFELGEKIENPNAVSIPIELAVALLTDLDGKIKMNIPVTGNTKDPQFSIRSIIMNAVVNSLSKIVTSPFQLIASLVGAKEDLSTISFPPGSSELKKPEQEKLDALAKAMRERPALSIGIKGAAYQEQDWPVIRKDALYEYLKKRRADEINQQGKRKIRAQYVELTEDDYKRLLADMFIEKFPHLAKKSLLGTPKLINPEAGDFYEVAKHNLFTIIKPEQERLNELASSRARNIAKYIGQRGGVPNERVFILDTVIDPKRDHKEVVSTLSLKTN